MIRFKHIFFLLGLGLLLPATSHADIDRGAAWLKADSTHYRFHFSEHNRQTALDLAAFAEQAFTVMAEWTGYQPKSRIHVVIISDNDITNGSATPYPHNQIRLYTMAPRQPSQLLEYGDWLQLLFVHELVHIFHLDMHRMPGTIFRKIFGRNFVQAISTDRNTYPLGIGFPNALLPDTFTEGYAVWAESTLFGSRGRANGALARSRIRNLARDGALPGVGAANGLRRAYPGGGSGYLYGGAFHRYLAQQQDVDLAQAYQLNATGLFPFFYGIPYWIRSGDRVAVDWRQWQAYERAQAQQFDQTLDRPAKPRLLAGPFLDLSALEVANDGQLWASLSTGRDHRAIGTIENGAFVPTINRFGGSSFALEPDGRIFFESLDVRNNTLRKSNLQVVHSKTGQEEQLTQTGGAFEPDVDGNRIVFVQRTAPGYCLVVHRRGHRYVNPVPEHSICWPEAQVPQLPRWSPDGQRIVFSIWRSGTFHDIGVWHPERGDISYPIVSDGDELQPRFSTDGERIYFISTMADHPELYSAPVSDGGDWRRHTRTRSGVWLFAIHGEQLTYAAPGGGGWTIYQAPLDAGSPVSVPAPLPSNNAAATATAVTAPATTATLGPVSAYHPGRTALPTGWSPIFGIGLRDTDRYGVQLGGQDVVGFVQWNLQASLSRKKNPAADLQLTRHFERVDVATRHQLFPVSEVSVSNAEFVFRNEMSVQRPIIHIDKRQYFRPGLAIENRFRPTGLARVQLGLTYGFDSRKHYAWSIVPADGIDVVARVASDSGFDDLEVQDLRAELSAQSGGFLFWKAQWQLSALAAAHTLVGGPLKYGLRPPTEVATFARRYISRAVPAVGVANVDRFALWESEFILPLWYPQAGPGSIPLYVDYLATRMFVSGAHWKNNIGVDQQLFGGVELELKAFFNWNFSFPPVRFGVRWPLLYNRTPTPDLYLRVGATFSG